MKLRAVLIDDILGQAKDPESSYGSAGFQAAHGDGIVDFTFISPMDRFLGRYTAAAALEQIETLGFLPDIFLIDLVYDHELRAGGGHIHLGLEIVERIAATGHLAAIPRALFSTIGVGEPAIGFNGQTIVEVLDDHDTAYINKDRALDGSLSVIIRDMVKG